MLIDGSSTLISICSNLLLQGCLKYMNITNVYDQKMLYWLCASVYVKQINVILWLL